MQSFYVYGIDILGLTGGDEMIFEDYFLITTATIRYNYVYKKRDMSGVKKSDSSKLKSNRRYKIFSYRYMLY